MTESEMRELEDFCKRLPEIQRFAKALWGEEKVMAGTNGNQTVWFNAPNWVYNLQMMVVAEDPIEYLGAHLDG